MVKTTRVIPILKKKTLNTSDISNYEPVSLLSFLEYAVYKSTVSLFQYKVQDPIWSGFKEPHPTETALVAINEKLYVARPAKLSSVLIFLTLSAAFDRDNHKTLP